MRTAVICLGVLAAGSVLSGEAAAQFVPGPSFLGDFGDTGFAPRSATPDPMAGADVQADAGDGLSSDPMEAPAAINPQRRKRLNIRQRPRTNPYSAFQGRGSYPLDPNTAAPPSPSPSPYLQPFPYPPRMIPNTAIPSFAPQPPLVGNPLIAPHAPFAGPSRYMLNFPMLDPSMGR